MEKITSVFLATSMIFLSSIGNTWSEEKSSNAKYEGQILINNSYQDKIVYMGTKESKYDPEYTFYAYNKEQKSGHKYSSGDGLFYTYINPDNGEVVQNSWREGAFSWSGVSNVSFISFPSAFNISAIPSNVNKIDNLQLYSQLYDETSTGNKVIDQVVYDGGEDYWAERGSDGKFRFKHDESHNSKQLEITQVKFAADREGEPGTYIQVYGNNLEYSYYQFEGAFTFFLRSNSNNHYEIVSGEDIEIKEVKDDSLIFKISDDYTLRDDSGYTGYISWMGGTKRIDENYNNYIWTDGFTSFKQVTQLIEPTLKYINLIEVGVEQARFSYYIDGYNLNSDIEKAELSYKSNNVEYTTNIDEINFNEDSIMTVGGFNEESYYYDFKLNLTYSEKYNGEHREFALSVESFETGDYIYNNYVKYQGKIIVNSLFNQGLRVGESIKITNESTGGTIYDNKYIEEAEYVVDDLGETQIKYEIIFQDGYVWEEKLTLV